MANDFFQFKKFTVHQARCAMKVGTDGTLLGAWASGGGRILDAGTGTGLIALMMAQRFPEAAVSAIDVDSSAVLQAAANVQDSPFAGRISVCESSLQTYCSQPFDAIVCNPPFFVDALPCPDGQRNMARHAATLSYRDLFVHAHRLLQEKGELSAIIPFDYRNLFDMEATVCGMFASRICAVRTKATKPVRRYLLAYRKEPPAYVEQTELVVHSEAYNRMLKDFYLSLP